ncbi:MAG: protein-disulfide reductase DsbD domain-containing protein [Phycisphaerales bacterium]
MTHTTHISACRLLTIAFLCVVLLLVPQTSAQPNSGDPRISGSIEPVAELLTNNLVFLTINLEIDKEWHTYWPGINDTGYGISVEFNPVDGITFGDPVFPTPKRYIAPGDILDHIYEDQIQIHVPVEVDGSLVGENPIAIEATVDYLICKEVCIPESIVITTSVNAKYSLDTDVNRVISTMTGASSGLDYAVLIPDTLNDENYVPFEDTSTMVVDGKTLQVVICGESYLTRSWSGDVFTLRRINATGYKFFPDDNCSNPVDLMLQGQSESSIFTMAFDRQYEDNPDSLARISGRLRVHYGDGWEDYNIDYTQPLTQEIKP